MRRQYPESFFDEEHFENGLGFLKDLKLTNRPKDSLDFIDNVEKNEASKYRSIHEPFLPFDFDIDEPWNPYDQ
jgi:hypothetical protein